MKRLLVVAMSIVPVVLLAAGLRAESPSPEQTKLERGQYIVHHVAMCVECHTPRNDEHELIESRLLHGADLKLESNYKGLEFAPRTPKIANLPGYSDEAAIRLLTEGIAVDGVPPRPPMPPFRMTREDAEAVVAYLKSVW